MLTGLNLFDGIRIDHYILKKSWTNVSKIKILQAQ